MLPTDALPYEELRRQLHLCQTELYQWQVKCGQLRNELESVDLACYLVKQENHKLTMKLQETELLLDANKVAFENLIIESRLQFQSTEDKLKSPRNIVNRQYASTLCPITTVLESKLQTMPFSFKDSEMNNVSLHAVADENIFDASSHNTLSSNIDGRNSAIRKSRKRKVIMQKVFTILLLSIQ